MARKVSTKRKDNKGRILHDGESQRSDGRYMYRYKDSLGKVKYIYDMSLPELRKKEKEIAEQVLLGLTGQGEVTTLNQAWDRYLASKRGLKPTTIHNYKQSYNCYARDVIGDIPVAQIRYSLLRDFYNNLIHDKKIAISTLETLNITLNPMFNALVRDGFIRANPCKGLIKSLKTENGYTPTKRHSMTVKEQSRILEYMQMSPIYCKWRDLFIFMLGTGLRISEVCGLTWDDIDFEAGTLSVKRELMRRSLNGVHGYYMATPKTKNSVRTIPLLPDVYMALMRHKSDMSGRTNDFEFEGVSGFVWLTKDGVPLNHQNIDGMLCRLIGAYNRDEERIAKEEGRDPFIIRKISAHTLRHTCATRLCEATENVAFVSSFLGHSSIQITLDIYAECQPDFMSRTAEEVAKKVVIVA